MYFLRVVVHRDQVMKQCIVLCIVLNNALFRKWKTLVNGLLYISFIAVKDVI